MRAGVTPGMDFTEATSRRLLALAGIPAEQHDEIIAKQREIARLRREQQRAVERNVTAMASVVGDRMGLPEGLSFEYR